MSLKNKMFAEMLGTAWLVLGGCGTAVFAASAGMGALGVALAFGLSLLTMAYAIGPISGCHINPAVTLGLVAGKKFCARQAVPYIIAQVAGAFLGGWIICMIAQGAGTDITSFASNGFGDLSPGGYSMKAVFIAEAVLTFFFLFIIMRSTKDEKLVGFAPISIGLSLALIHMISIPISNTSVNPARSTSQAFFDGAGAIDQLWLFWAAPILGAVVAGLLARCMCCSKENCCDDKKSCCDGK